MNSNATSQVAKTVRGCEVIPLGTLDHTTQEAYGWLVFITVKPHYLSHHNWFEHTDHDCCKN